MQSRSLTRVLPSYLGFWRLVAAVEGFINEGNPLGPGPKPRSRILEVCWENLLGRYVLVAKTLKLHRV